MREACVIASGPSLTADDVEFVRVWREASQDRYVIVANTTFRIAPWADAMYAMDDKWWKVHREEVRETFKGKPYCHIGKSAEGFAQMVGRKKRYMHFGNSGAAILAFCCSDGFDRIIMLGYDCSVSKGTHWHGDHPKGLGNCSSVHRWPQQFAKLRGYYAQANIVNASRRTVLSYFPKATLEEALGLAAIQEAA